MITLSMLVPVNLEAEKKRFFAENCTYNPQFEYESYLDQDDLLAHGLPQKEFLNLAEKIVHEGKSKNLEQEERENSAPFLNQSEVTQKVKMFLELHGLENRYEIVWSSVFVARTSITASSIKLRLPPAFRSQEDLLGMLYHEVGTHALRRVNYEQQPWFKKKKRYGFGGYLKTEEGLASLHSLFPLKDKSAYGAALRYLAVEKAQNSSFVETYRFVSKYVLDDERRWAITLKQKRGLTDTSMPGGFTKDLVYFAGLVEVWRYLEKRDFDPTVLYFGKLAKEDVKRALELNPDFAPLLPSFYTTNKSLYQKVMQEIGEANHLAL